MWEFQSDNTMEIFIVAIHTSSVWEFFHDAYREHDHMCTLLITFVDEINDLFLQHTNKWSFNHMFMMHIQSHRWNVYQNELFFKEYLYLVNIYSITMLNNTIEIVYGVV